MIGILSFGTLGEELDLYVGEALFDGRPCGPIRIWMPMKYDLRIRWHAPDFQLDDPFILKDRQTLTIEHPALGTLDLPVDVNDSDGWGGIPSSDHGAAGGLDRVVLHWINLPFIHPSGVLTDGQQYWTGRWQVDSCGWQLTLDGRPDLLEELRLARQVDAQYLITHVGELRRADGTVFDAAEATNVLFGWQLAMSFALGRWIAPALPVGFNPKGERTWEQWASWRCDHLRGYESWWDTHTGDDLGAFVDSFLRSFLDPGRNDEVRLTAMYVIAANHSGTTAEGKVMLAQAALEYLTWTRLVLSKRMTRRRYGALNSAERLRLLLTEAHIPTDVPEGLDGLRALAEQKGLDGPSATSWVRNRLVHPKDAGEPYRIEGLVWQGAQLLLEYGELLLLHGLKYQGKFMRRYPPGRFAHSSEPVPWIAL